MKVVLQRVRSAHVSVDGQIVGQIGTGYLLLVGIAAGDDAAVVRRLAGDVAKARLMPDAQGKFGIGLREAGAEALAVSQFTLLAAAKPEVARPLFDLFVQELATLVGRPVPTGVFGADMAVTLVNDGPVTVVLE